LVLFFLFLFFRSKYRSNPSGGGAAGSGAGGGGANGSSGSTVGNGGINAIIGSLGHGGGNMRRSSMAIGALASVMIGRDASTGVGGITAAEAREREERVRDTDRERRKLVDPAFLDALVGTERQRYRARVPNHWSTPQHQPLVLDRVAPETELLGMLPAQAGVVRSARQAQEQRRMRLRADGYSAAAAAAAEELDNDNNNNNSDNNNNNNNNINNINNAGAGGRRGDGLTTTPDDNNQPGDFGGHGALRSQHRARGSAPGSILDDPDAAEAVHQQSSLAITMAKLREDAAVETVHTEPAMLAILATANMPPAGAKYRKWKPAPKAKRFSG
jgi:hypothetical protein